MLKMTYFPSYSLSQISTIQFENMQPIGVGLLSTIMDKVHQCENSRWRLLVQKFLPSFSFDWSKFVINFFLYFFFSLFCSKFYNGAIVMPEAQAKFYF